MSLPQPSFKRRQAMPKMPRFLRPIVQYLLDEITARTPLAGIGVEIDQGIDGMQIHSLGGSSKAGGSAAALLPFQMVDATDAAGLKIQVSDGQVNDIYPDGMGYDAFVLNLVEEPYQGVYVIVTFDAETLEITSRTLGISDDPPKSTMKGGAGGDVPTLIILLGFVTITYDEESNPIVTPTSNIVGTIEFTFVYGAMNGQPALLPVQTFGDWLELPTPPSKP